MYDLSIKSLNIDRIVEPTKEKKTIIKLVLIKRTVDYREHSDLLRS
jgi:hypothetical protein